MKFNTLTPRQNVRHFADDIFRCVFVNEMFCYVIKISLMFVLNGSVDNNSVLVEVMAWRRTANKPLPEPRLT